MGTLLNALRKLQQGPKTAVKAAIPSKNATVRRELSDTTADDYSVVTADDASPVSWNTFEKLANERLDDAKALIEELELEDEPHDSPPKGTLLLDGAKADAPSFANRLLDITPEGDIVHPKPQGSDDVSSAPWQSTLDSMSRGLQDLAWMDGGVTAYSHEPGADEVVAYDRVDAAGEIDSTDELLPYMDADVADLTIRQIDILEAEENRIHVQPVEDPPGPTIGRSATIPLDLDMILGLGTGSPPGETEAIEDHPPSSAPKSFDPPSCEGVQTVDSPAPRQAEAITTRTEPETISDDSTEEIDHALAYAARVMSETEHLTLDLLRPIHAAPFSRGDADESSNTIPTRAELGDPADFRLPMLNDIGDELDETEERVLAEIDQAWDKESAALPVYSPRPERMATQHSRVQGRDAGIHRTTNRQELADGSTIVQTAFEHDVQRMLDRPEFAQQCTQLARNIQEDLGGAERGAIVLVSCEEEPHVSQLSALLANVWAGQNGSRILLIDGNLTRQSLSRQFQRTEVPGLAESLASDCGWQDVILPTHHPGIFLLPAGGRLDRRYAREDIVRTLLPPLRHSFQMVILDVGEASSPLAAPWLSAADVAYLVVRLGRTNRNAAQRVLANLAERGHRPTGCIITNSRAQGQLST